ncbi:hypothetical protein BGW38_005108 [Lunasporangiospora selenospora]|uniref:carbonic anhydrase n=1 Tax=Lunasporangiospora selenospora TaxID=979761 RepID=A0A9P6FPL8_9FUNG|nr:hypothetical protein BGW38_005108 [Lunasporangiospora selenospora]
MDGKKQSPIDIIVGAPFVHLQTESFEEVNYEPLRDVLCGYDGHAVSCQWDAAKNPTNSIVIKGKTYNLSNFHFHTPSEHRIDNHFADAELHLVHQSEDKALAVIGLLLEVTAQENPFFNWITALDKQVNRNAGGHGFMVKDAVTGAPVPGKEQAKYKVRKVDFKNLIKATREFTPRWEYEGSLTTPPCSEGVAWNVVKTPVRLGLKQYDALVSLEAFNSRYLQDREKK